MNDNDQISGAFEKFTLKALIGERKTYKKKLAIIAALFSIALAIAGYAYTQKQTQLIIPPESIAQITEEIGALVKDEIKKNRPIFWRDLPKEKRDQLAAYGFVLFPEILGHNYKAKYRRYIEWLLNEHGIANANVKNVYSATGLQDFEINGVLYTRIPGVFTTFVKRSNEVFHLIENIPAAYLEVSWGNVPDNFQARVWHWYSLAEPEALAELEGAPFDFKGFIEQRLAAYQQFKLAANQHQTP